MPELHTNTVKHLTDILPPTMPRLCTIKVQAVMQATQTDVRLKEAKSYAQTSAHGLRRRIRRLHARIHAPTSSRSAAQSQLQALAQGASMD